MLRNNAVSIVFMASMSLVTGCTSFLPYENEFQCKNTDHGKCIHPADAYREAVAATGPDASNSRAVVDRTKGSRRNRDADLVPVSETGGYDGYQDAVYEQLAVMIDKPVTPMVAPPKTVRTLILPYADQRAEGRLYMPRYVYSMLEGPKFVLGDYLMNGERDLAGSIAQGLFRTPASDLAAEGEPIERFLDPESLLRAALKGEVKE